MTGTPIGYRLRAARKKIGITQTKLAGQVGISISYLNLIEHDKRRIAGALLNRLSQALSIDLDKLGGVEDARLIQELTEMSSDQLFRELELEASGPQEIAVRRPGWAKAILKLYRSNSEAREMVDVLSDRLNRDPFLTDASHQILTMITSIRSFSEILEEFSDISETQRRRYVSLLAQESRSLGARAKSLFEFMSETDGQAAPGSPASEVEDFIIDARNFFPDLEEEADRLRQNVARDGVTSKNSLTEFIDHRLGVTVEPGDPGEAVLPGGSADLHFDKDNKLLIIGKHLSATTQRFQLAKFIFQHHCDDVLSRVVDDARLTSDDARNRARRAMARYAAGALLFPYDKFLTAAQKLRYDIQALCRRFDGSFEQICHRLVTLRKPGSEGIPFVFLRSDTAGNLSKRFNLPNLRLPRQGGVCPLWAVYRSFLTPGVITPQMVRLPDGLSFLFVARTVSKMEPAYGAPQKIYSVMIGCEAIYADQLVYGDGFDATSDAARGSGRSTRALPTGINCRTCPHMSCQHRAFAPLMPSR